MITKDIKDFCKIFHEEGFAIVIPVFWIIGGLLGWAAYAIYFHFGKNFWFAICSFLSFFFIFGSFSSFFVAYDELKKLKQRRIEEEKKRIQDAKDAERCKFIEKNFPIAYANFVKKNYTTKTGYFKTTTKEPEKSKIARISDETWEKYEKEAIELNRKRNILNSVYEKYPLSFTRCTERACSFRFSNIIMPNDRNMSLYYSINDIDKEDEKYKLMRSEQGLDDTEIRKKKLEDIEKEYKKKINFITIPVDKIKDENVERIYSNIHMFYFSDRASNDVDEELIRSSEDRYREELTHQDNLIKFYSEIQGINERDFYMDAFLKSEGISKDKLHFVVTHIDELDLFIAHSKELNLNNSKEGITRSALISNLKNCMNDWRELNLRPYYFFYYYYSKRFGNISKESEDAKRLIYGFKDGSKMQQNRVAMMLAKKLQDTFDLYDLSQITFVCAPASTKADQRFRFESFALEYACPYTTMKNGVNGIEVTQDGDASHLSEGQKNYEYIVKPEVINEKIVLLFDDIVTRGNTMHRCKSMLENAGATVVLQMSIGRTYSDYHGDNRRPHPWSGVI